MKVLLSSTMGFCAGVDRAVQTLDAVVDAFDETVYVRHAIVHNHHVVKHFEKKGVIFVEDTLQVPEGAVLVFSAHGVSPKIKNEAQKRKLRIFDATCPLVTRVHLQVAKYSAKGMDGILIGHKNHVEIQGTQGYFQNKDGTLHIVQTIFDAKNIQIEQKEHCFVSTQTTLSVDESQAIMDILLARFPKLTVPKRQDICYATQNRQDALRVLCKASDAVVVIGSAHSSNTTRLMELSKKGAQFVYRIESSQELDDAWFENMASHGVNTVGITAGASTPQSVVDAVLAKFESMGASEFARLSGKDEDMFFPVSKEVKELLTLKDVQ